MQAGIQDTQMSPEALIFSFPASATIQNIEELIESVKKLMTPGKNVIVDAAHTEVITTPGVQLLLSLARTLEQNGGALGLINPKETFTQTFDALGLKSRLTEWEESKWLKKS